MDLEPIAGDKSPYHSLIELTESSIRLIYDMAFHEKTGLGLLISSVIANYAHEVDTRKDRIHVRVHFFLPQRIGFPVTSATEKPKPRCYGASRSASEATTLL